jgi:crotonobetainyl-CoA:carnitine CoA-transferase CaiB-like acyl-CoA transferase
MWGGKGFYKGMRIDYLYLNANKYFLGLDFRKEEGYRLLIELVKKADVFVENMERGTLDRYGLGYLQLREVNPRLIYLSASGYGQFGPLHRLPSYDIIGQAESGIMDTTGWEENEVDELYRLPDYPGDWLPSTMAVSAVLATLIYRERTGRGQYIDLSQAASLQRFMYHFVYMSVSGRLKRSGFFDPFAPVSGVFKTRDGKYVAIAAMTEGQVKALAGEVAGLVEALGDRWRVFRVVQEWASGKTLEEVLEAGRRLKVPIQPVMTDIDVLRDLWRWERGSVVRINDRLYGEIVVPGPLFKMAGADIGVRWVARPVGYHNKLVLKKWLGYSPEEVDGLVQRDVLGYWDGQPGNMPPPGWKAEEDPVYQGERDEV